MRLEGGPGVAAGEGVEEMRKEAGLEPGDAENAVLDAALAHAGVLRHRGHGLRLVA